MKSGSKVFASRQLSLTFGFNPYMTSTPQLQVYCFAYQQALNSCITAWPWAFVPLAFPPYFLVSQQLTVKQVDITAAHAGIQTILCCDC